MNAQTSFDGMPVSDAVNAHKQTEGDIAVKERLYAVTADELRSFVERIEHLETEKRDIAEQIKEVYAESKGRGYDTKALRKIIALRKRDPDDVAEEHAVLEIYLAALEMK